MGGTQEGAGAATERTSASRANLPTSNRRRREAYMPEREVSSLDRFVMRQAPPAFDVLRRRILGIVGSVYCAVGLAALVGALVGALTGSAAVFATLPGVVFGSTGALLLWLRGLFQRQSAADSTAWD